MKTTIFKSPQTNKNWKILYIRNCKIEHAIYLRKCTFCNLQYVSKNKRPCNIRLNNHRKDIKDLEAILADKHFQKSSHRFNEHARLTITARLKNKPLQRDIRTSILIKFNWWSCCYVSIQNQLVCCSSIVENSKMTSSWKIYIWCWIIL